MKKQSDYDFCDKNQHREPSSLANQSPFASNRDTDYNPFGGINIESFASVNEPFEHFRIGHTMRLIRNTNEDIIHGTYFKNDFAMDYMSIESNNSIGNTYDDLIIENESFHNPYLRDKGRGSEAGKYSSIDKKKEDTESNIIQMQIRTGTKSEEIGNGVVFETIKTTTKQQQRKKNELQPQNTESETGKNSPIDEEKEEKEQSSIIRRQIKGQKATRKRNEEVDHVVDLEATTITTSKQRRNKTKNLVKNYGKAIASFCVSEAASSYLQKSLQIHQVCDDDFKSFIFNNKESIDGIDALRELLSPVAGHDTTTEIKCKCVFKDLSIVFIRDFAINWIFSSKKLQYRSTYLDFRFKILRRVKNPEYFTYLHS